MVTLAERVRGTCGELCQSGIDVVFYQAADALIVEGDGCAGVQPLVESAHAGGPLPARAGVRLQYDFLAQGFCVLFLHQGIDVGFGEVLVQGHPVVQVLESGDAAQDEVPCVVFDAQSAVCQVAPVSAGAVVRDGADVFGAVFLFAVGASGIGVGVSALVGVLVIGGEVQFQVGIGKPDGTYASSCLVIGVDALAVESVLKNPPLCS